jgi:hypothetical protein
MESGETTMKPWYDTKEGLESRVQQGISGLHEIKRARRAAYYDRKERLSEWCLLGLYWTDTCGNFSIIDKGAPRDGYGYWQMEEVYSVPDVMDREETYKFTQRMSMPHGPCLPPEDARCDRCGRGWKIDNVRDYYLGHGEDARPRHKKCQELAIIEDEQKHFKGILDRSEIPYTEMIMVPNRYHPNPDPTYYAPWFLVETPKGRIQIGWRKRVISIDWSESGWSAKGVDVVEDPDVTHWEQGVHAYGADKAVEALRKVGAS